MIKRFLSLVLCLCMMCTATVALAAGEVKYPTDQTGDFDTAYGVDITAIATSTADEASDPVYSVEIVWGDMKFAWGHSKETTTAAWDPETHTYKYTVTETGADATEGWYMLNEGTAVKPASTKYDLGDKTQDTVMVFNHSNCPVDVKIAIENAVDTAGTDSADLTATFTETSNAAADTAADTWALNAGTESDVYADDGSCVIGTVKIDQESMSSTTEVTIARLNVTISKAE